MLCWVQPQPGGVAVAGGSPPGDAKGVEPVRAAPKRPPSKLETRPGQSGQGAARKERRTTRVQIHRAAMEEQERLRAEGVAPSSADPPPPMPLACPGGCGKNQYATHCKSDPKLCRLCCVARGRGACSYHAQFVPAPKTNASPDPNGQVNFI